MKDLDTRRPPQDLTDHHDKGGLARTLTALNSGDLEAVRGAMHPEARIVGVQDGVFVSADRATYLGFRTSMRTAGPLHPETLWVDETGRIAVACIVERTAASRTTSYVTLLREAEGWKVISKTFHDAGSL